jgi:hypothetical protein
MESPNGWILPGGEYVECGFCAHLQCAIDVFKQRGENLEQIAVKVSMSENYGVVCFSTESRGLTQEQKRRIEEYCEVFDCKLPPIYFTLEGLI